MKSTKELLKVIEKRKPEGIGLNPQSPPVRSIFDSFNIPRPFIKDGIPEVKKKIKNLVSKK